MDEQDRMQAEEATLAALVSQYAGTLYRVAFSVLRNPADAEDAVQEAFIRVLRHRDMLAEVRDERVWLIRIVWNIVLDRKRRAKTRPETDDVAELARVLPSKGLSAEELASAAQHHEDAPPRLKEGVHLAGHVQVVGAGIGPRIGRHHQPFMCHDA